MLFIKRLKNLWELSKYKPTTSVNAKATNELVLQQTEYPKKKQVLATIIQEKTNPFEV